MKSSKTKIMIFSASAKVDICGFSPLVFISLKTTKGLKTVKHYLDQMCLYPTKLIAYNITMNSVGREMR